MNTAVEQSVFADYKVADIHLADWGRRELEIAESGHFALGDLQLSSPPISEVNICDFVVGENALLNSSVHNRFSQGLRVKGRRPRATHRLCPCAPR